MYVVPSIYLTNVTLMSAIFVMDKPFFPFFLKYIVLLRRMLFQITW